MQKECHDLTDEILSLVRQNKLTCANAQQLAKRAGVAPSVVGRTAERLGIKISDCQLGCFDGFKEN